MSGLYVVPITTALLLAAGCYSMSEIRVEPGATVGNPPVWGTASTSVAVRYQSPHNPNKPGFDVDLGLPNSVRDLSEAVFKACLGVVTPELKIALAADVKALDWKKGIFDSGRLRHLGVLEADFEDSTSSGSHEIADVPEFGEAMETKAKAIGANVLTIVTSKFNLRRTKGVHLGDLSGTVRGHAYWVDCSPVPPPTAP